MMGDDPRDRVTELFRRSTVSELKEWIHARLNHHDAVGGAQGEARHELIADLYSTMEHAVCVNLQKAVHALVEDLASQPEMWPVVSAQGLLMLADPVLMDSPRRVELVDTLLQIVKPTERSTFDPALSFSAAQALLTLDTKVTPSFWLSLYKDGAWAPIVVEGLLRTDIKMLQGWLAQRLPDVDLEDAMINLLPLIVDGPGSRVAAELIASLGQLFSSEMHDELIEVAKTLGIGEETRIFTNVELVNTLSGALHLVAKLLRDTNPSDFTGDVIESFRRNFSSVRATLQRQTDLFMLPSSTLEELWTIYVDCLDHALAYPPLEFVCIEELALALPAPLLKEIVEHLIADRGFEKESLLAKLREAGVLDIEEELRVVKTSRAASFAMRMPTALRDEVVTELWRREEERQAREKLLAMQDSAFGDDAWKAFA